MDFENLELMGAPFSHVETYFYYDEPLTFTIRSTIFPGLYYIVNTVDVDDETGSRVWLAAALSTERFHAMRSGTITFQSTFSRAPNGTLFQINQDWNDNDEESFAIKEIKADDLPFEWLPSEGARLNLKTHTAKPFDESNVIALARAQERTVFSVRVEQESANITEFPARSAGQLQLALSGLVTALAKESAGSKGQGAIRAANEIETTVLGLQAASFVVLLGIDSPGLFEATDITEEVFDDIASFVEAVASGQTAILREEFKKHTKATRNRFKDTLKPLADTGSGISVTSVVANSGKPQTTTASPVSVRAAVNLVENTEPIRTPIEVKRGVLTGLLLRTQRFEIFDIVTQLRYVGTMTDEAKREANGLAVGDTSFITARIMAETPFADAPESSDTTRYSLESINKVGS